MAAMVASGTSSVSPSSSSQDKSSRNKRKFRAETPVFDPNDPSLPENSCPTYEQLPIDPENNEGFCECCRDLSCGPGEDLEVKGLQDTDWSDVTETQLEEVLLANLDTIYKSAIQKITAYGYKEEIAMNAILTTGRCYGCKDTASNIADTSLAYLASGEKVDSSPRENYPEEFQKLGKKALSDMISVLREVRPFLTPGDAMWCLLICDMNVCHACALDTDPLKSLVNDESSGGSCVSPNMKVESNSNISNVSPSLTGNSSQPEAHNVIGIPDLPSGRFTASSNVVGEPSSQNVAQRSPLDEKHLGSRKAYGSSSKREVLRQKSFHLEKNYRGIKSGLRSGKLSSLGGLSLDRKGKPILDSININSKTGSLRISKTIEMDVPQAAANNLSFGVGPSPLPLPNTKHSLSVPSNKSRGASPEPDNSVEASNSSICDGIPEDEKDEMVLKLTPRVKELENQLQEWTEWAQQKVMQAARRLGKDKAELQTLRQEKDEVGRLQKEKQTLEESTMKKLSDMENALNKASIQVEKANAAMRRLEFENSHLRHEMEAAKIRAEESAASCQEVSMRELETLKKFQSWDRQKALFHEELTAEKRTLSQLKQQLEQSKESRSQIEARLRQEEKVKEEALVKVESERKERERIEASAKSEEDILTLKAEHDVNQNKAEICRLEHQIAKLRLTMDFTKVAALRWDFNDKAQLNAKIMALNEPGNCDVLRDRECVMCLSEEMSVVFLPCAHQVICTKCNELHERQGMKDCPSCRAPIQQRISIRTDHS